MIHLEVCVRTTHQPRPKPVWESCLHMKSGVACPRVCLFEAPAPDEKPWSMFFSWAGLVIGSSLEHRSNYGRTLFLTLSMTLIRFVTTTHEPQALSAEQRPLPQELHIQQ